jgi:16S rRNA (guanine(966)-N(2))-methyltransferase RsmD
MLKGRTIPFSARFFDKAEVTPQKVKGAVFSLLGEDLEGRTFLDLFAGSGQMALEAASRGSSSVVTGERDRSRAQHISESAENLDVCHILEVFPLDYRHLLRIMKREGRAFDVIFVDPPYEKVKGRAETLIRILEDLSSGDLLRDDGRILVQHFTSNILPGIIGKLARKESREYGSTSITIYGL